MTTAEELKEKILALRSDLEVRLDDVKGLDTPKPVLTEDDRQAMQQRLQQMSDKVALAELPKLAMADLQQMTDRKAKEESEGSSKQVFIMDADGFEEFLEQFDKKYPK